MSVCSGVVGRRLYLGLSFDCTPWMLSLVKNREHDGDVSVVNVEDRVRETTKKRSANLEMDRGEGLRRTADPLE